ncbi:hypothetical protein CMV_015584 [Castanea mollissima]|uniref:Uncharacterized protein n=1 Tax=Castanea mollissima TaxID=60419 RepID=A0A8J4QUV1_9ROSI|nr:hypothetical protein CMV_015584 [Castanea mollissima]
MWLGMWHLKQFGFNASASLTTICFSLSWVTIILAHSNCSDDISLDGLEQELEECKNDDVVANILSEGTKLREYTKGVENNLRKVELDSIQHNSRIQPPSQISLQKHPVNSGPSPANLQLQGPRHHRPTPASPGAAHSRQNQVRFLLLAGKTTQSLRFYLG